jgi:hypothetical protein
MPPHQFRKRRFRTAFGIIAQQVLVVEVFHS